MGNETEKNEHPTIDELAHWSVNSISRYVDSVQKNWMGADQRALQISARMELVKLIRAVVTAVFAAWKNNKNKKEKP